MADPFYQTTTANSQQGGPTTGTTSGTNPYTGWASQFPSNAGLQGIYNSPFSLLPDVYKGLNLNGPGYNYLQDFGADPMTLFAVMNGSQGAGAGLGANEGDYANFLNNLYSMLGGRQGQGAGAGTGPGRGFSASELTRNVFNANPTSALGSLMTAGDSDTQMRTLFNILRDISNVSMNPLAARGYQSMLQKSGTQALNEMLHSTVDQTGGAMNANVYETLKRIAPQLMVGER